MTPERKEPCGAAPMMNTRICYLYRDASNYKQYNEAVLIGEMTKEQLARIARCLSQGEFFVPRDVGLPEMRITDYRTDDDHCWFEWEIVKDEESGCVVLPLSGVVYTDDPPTVQMTGEELAQKFEAIEQWDEQGWMADYVYKPYDELSDNDCPTWGTQGGVL